MGQPYTKLLSNERQGHFQDGQHCQASGCKRSVTYERGNVPLYSMLSSMSMPAYRRVSLVPSVAEARGTECGGEVRMLTNYGVSRAH